MSDDRRGFLKKGLLGGAILTAAGAGFLATRGGTKHPPTGALMVLDATSFSAMVAVAEVVLPFADDFVHVAMRVDGSLSFAPSRVQDEIKSALGLLENGLSGLLTRSQITPFTSLSIGDRSVALNRWRDSRIVLLRSAYHAVRKLAIAGYYSEMKRAKETGYPGPAFEKPVPWEIEARKAISAPFVVTGPTDVPSAPSPDANPAVAPSSTNDALPSQNQDAGAATGGTP